MCLTLKHPEIYTVKTIKKREILILLKGSHETEFANKIIEI